MPNVPDPDDRPLSALPSPLARGLAFVSILVAGVAGAVIGWALVDVQCSGDCSTPSAIGLVIGALSAAIGTTVVAILVLRAMGEWREINDRNNGVGRPDQTGER
jgi:hypothetical protein